MGKQEVYQQHVISYFDKYAVAYVIGLEVDEYMNASTCNHYAYKLKLAMLESKPVGVHQKPLRYDYVNWEHIDVLFFQYGFGLSPSSIENKTKWVLSKTSKPVVAAEYHLSSDTVEAKTLGQAAVGAGAIATGNGR